MEVQGRTAHASGRLSDAFARAWAQRWAALALVTVVTVAALVIDAQPVRSPWWTYADADASYTSSALNLMLGRPMTFVDHPGLPITEAVAVTFGIETLLDQGGVREHSRLAFVDRTLLNLDGARGTFRGFAIAFYLLGALLAFFLAARLFEHWTWGLAAGLLWFAAPGLVAMSIQLRPDVLLAALCMVFAFGIARALAQRSAAAYAATAALVGFTVMVKLHALALLPALALAALWRPAADVDSLSARAASWLHAHRVVVGSVGAAWLLLVLLMNAPRFPFSLTAGQLQLAIVVLAVAAAAGAAWFLGRLRFGALLVLSFIGGLLVPVTIDVPDGLRALVYVTKNVSGQGVQEDVDSFSTPFTELANIVGTPATIVLLVAVVAAGVGVHRRDPVPVVWTAGALTMGVMAFARAPNVHYFAPSFVLAAFALLWLLRRTPRTAVPLLAWPVVLYVLWPAWHDRKAPAAEQARLAAVVAPAKQYVDAHLKPGEVALVPSYWPFADSRYFELVQIYVDYTPPYPYRYLPTTAAVRPFLRVHGYRPRYYVGPQAAAPGHQDLQLGDLGLFSIAKAPGGDMVADIQSGPGITEPW